MRHTIIYLCLFFLLFGAVAEAISPPPMPQLIKGRVYIDDKPAPIGTNITINIDGKTQSTLVQTPGEYSIITGNEGDNKIEFFVNRIKANETDYVPGALSNIDLSVKTPYPLPASVGIAVLVIIALLIIKRKL